MRRWTVFSVVLAVSPASGASPAQEVPFAEALREELDCGDFTLAPDRILRGGGLAAQVEGTWAVKGKRLTLRATVDYSAMGGGRRVAAEKLVESYQRAFLQGGMVFLLAPTHARACLPPGVEGQPGKQAWLKVMEAGAGWQQVEKVRQVLASIDQRVLVLAEGKARNPRQGIELMYRDADGLAAAKALQRSAAEVLPEVEWKVSAWPRADAPMVVAVGK